MWWGRRLDRPENAGLKGYFAKLAAAKATIDEKSATIGVCSWAQGLYAQAVML